MAGVEKITANYIPQLQPKQAQPLEDNSNTALLKIRSNYSQPINTLQPVQPKELTFGGGESFVLKPSSNNPFGGLSQLVANATQNEDRSYSIAQRVNAGPGHGWSDTTTSWVA